MTSFPASSIVATLKMYSPRYCLSFFPNGPATASFPSFGKPSDVREVTGENLPALLSLDLSILWPGPENAEDVRPHAALIGTESLRELGVEGMLLRCHDHGAEAEERKDESRKSSGSHDSYYTEPRPVPAYER